MFVRLVCATFADGASRTVYGARRHAKPAFSSLQMLVLLFVSPLPMVAVLRSRGFIVCLCGFVLLCIFSFSFPELSAFLFAFIVRPQFAEVRKWTYFFFFYVCILSFLRCCCCCCPHPFFQQTKGEGGRGRRDVTAKRWTRVLSDFWLASLLVWSSPFCPFFFIF